MSPWRNGLCERMPTALVPRRRYAYQISDSASASGKRSPFNTFATRPGLTRKAAAMLWMASPRRRRFQISMASASVSGGDVGADRGILGRDFGRDALPLPCPDLRSGRSIGGRFGSDVIAGIESPSKRKAACQTRWTGYVRFRGADSRAAIAVVIRLRRAALPGAALRVWPNYHGVVRSVLQEESPVTSLPDCPSNAHNERHSPCHMLRSGRWLGGHIEDELWKAKHDGICCFPPDQRPSNGNPRRGTA